MSIQKTIDELSEQLDTIIKDERQTSEFVTSNLRECVNEILQCSFQKARNKVGLGSGGTFGVLGTMVLGKLFSNEGLVDSAIEQRDKYDTSENDLVNNWKIISPKINNLSINDLCKILYTNKERGFLQALSFLENA